MKLVSVGECTRDCYLDLGVEFVGGISLNFAVNARRSGASQVALVSCTGTDGAARAIRDKVAREGVDATHLSVMHGSTASQEVLLSHLGERVFPSGGYQAGVLADYSLDASDLSLDASDLDFIRTFDVVAAPYFRQVEHLFQPAMQAAAGAMRVADLLEGEDLGHDLAGIDVILDTIDLVFIGGDEATAELLLPRSAQTRTLIVVTHGALGSSALCNGRRYVEPAVEVPHDQRIDTTGCGDAFQAAFTVEYFERGAIPDALRAGALRASRVIRHLGATGV